MLILALLACKHDDTFVLDEWCDRDDVRCETIDVPANADEPDGPTYALQTLTLLAEGDPAPEPVVMLNDGPGAPTIAALAPLLDDDWGRALREHRDVILIDLRGTGYSAPDLSCPELESAYAGVTPRDWVRADLAVVRKDALVTCATRLDGEGVDLATFNSHQAALDVRSALDQLGTQAYDVWGMGYGALLAQHLVLVDPRTNAIALDSVQPIDLSLLANAPYNGTLAIRALDADCEADPDCNSDTPAYADTLYGLVDSLNAAPESIESTDPYADRPYTWTLDGDEALVRTLGALAWDHPRRSPALVTAVAEGLRDPFVSDAQPELIYDPENSGMWLAAHRCAEQIAYNPDEQPTTGIEPRVAAAVAPQVQEAFDTCAALDLGPLDEDLLQPLTEPIPTLMISGRYDPVTPAWFADHLADSQPGAMVYTAPGTGHRAASECTWAIAAEFFDDPRSPPDATCLDDRAGFERLPKHSVTFVADSPSEPG